MSNILNLGLFINNSIYKHKFDFEVVKEKEVFVNIALYNLLYEQDLNNIDIEIFIENCSIFKGKATALYLEGNDNQVILKVDAKLDSGFLDNINLLSKGDNLTSSIPCNLNMKVKEDIILQGNHLEKLETLKENLSLPYFAILEDRINFVDFESEPKLTPNLMKVEVNTTEKNFKYIQMDSKFNGSLNVGDIFTYKDDTYAVESIIYTLNGNDFKQEIYGINHALHKARYLK
ncbi:MAG: hypothetical protein LBH40_04185 [Alphaproteobacteria bacterium]|jgi:hypothetical protein|nr:hypothetical protein [Alphaproteobacteria bacterium]